MQAAIDARPPAARARGDLRPAPRVAARRRPRDLRARHVAAHAARATARARPAPTRPHAVVWPEHVREVVAVVKLAREQRIPIVPYGGGSGVCGGAVPVLRRHHDRHQADAAAARGAQRRADLRRRGRAVGRAVRARAGAPRLHVRALPVVDLLLDGRRLAGDPRGRPAVDQVRQGRGSLRRADRGHRPRRGDRDRRAEPRAARPELDPAAARQRGHARA